MKKINYSLSILLLLLFTGNKAIALDYYWVGGSGNWSDFANHWATTSGGNTFHSQVPQTVDNVFFDANSFAVSNQSVTADQTVINCANMDWTGALNNPEFTGGFTYTLRIYGSLKFITAMRLTLNNILFEATTTGKTITSAGQYINACVLKGIGGGWTLMDDLNGHTVSLQNGSFNTNNKTLNIRVFSSEQSTQRTLTLGTSVINCGLWKVDHYLLAFDAGTSFINNESEFTASSSTQSTVTYYDVNVIHPFTAYFYPFSASATFHNVVFNGSAEIMGSSTFNSLTLTTGKSYRLLSASTQTIINNFTASGTCNSVITFFSSTIGVQAAIRKTSGTLTTNYTSLKDISATGGAIFTANNAIDLGNNTGWNLITAAPQNLYWVGGAGDWQEPAHWSTSSGGTGGACLPTPYDNVFFDAGSGFTATSNTVTLNTANATCANMDWTGALNNPEFTGSTLYSLRIYGSLKFITAMRLTLNNILFEATTTGKTITSAGQYINACVLKGIGGGWTLMDDLNGHTVSLQNGSFNTNNKTLNIRVFSSEQSTQRTLTLGTSVINCGLWKVDHYLLAFDAGTSFINNESEFTASSSTQSTVTYYDVNVIHPFTAYFYPFSASATFHNVVFNGSAEIMGSSTFNSLTLTTGKSYRLLSASTQTIINNFTASGTCNSVITFFSSTIGVQAAIRKTSGTLTTNYTSLKDISATGGAIFTANNAIDLGNNTGWNLITAAPQNLYWVGGAGDWQEPAHWSTSSGGTGGACLPTPYDNVFFDAGSGFTATSNTVTLNTANATCANMDWTGALNNPEFTGSTLYSLRIYGSLKFITAMRLTLNNILFEATTTGKTITSAGQYINACVLKGIGGGWTLMDDLNGHTVSLQNGSFNTNNKTLNIRVFSSEQSTQRTLTLGTSVINCGLWKVDHYLLAFDAGTSFINNESEFTASSSTQSTVTYYDVNVIHPFTAYFYPFSASATFHNVVFNGSAEIMGSSTFYNLNFTTGKVYQLQAGSIQTIINNLFSTGTGGFPIRIQSSSIGSPATFFKASGILCLDFLRLSDNIATGGATFYAGSHSEDISGNSGWIFGSPGGSELNLPAFLKRCNNDTISIAAPTGFTNYTWSPGYNVSSTTGSTINVWPSVDTFYILTANSGCGLATDTVRVGVFTSALINLGNDSSLCENTSIELNAGDGFTNYTWSNGGNGSTNTVSSVGTYKVSATDTNGCISEDSLSILNIYPNPEIDLGDNKSICEKTTLLLNPGDAFTGYLWQDGAVSKTYAASLVGLYWVEVKNDNNCKTRDSLTVVSILPSPTVKLGKDTSVCNGEQLILNAATQGVIKYLWNDNSGNSNYPVNNTGAYSVQVTDANNCIGGDTINVGFKNCDCNVSIPNAFTPNNDGFNDAWKISRETCVLQIEVAIYNRYGSRVFYDRNYQDNWRGTYNNKPLPDATYYYAIKIHYRGGRIWNRNGDLTILR